jgi:filamentous hemagglutinin
MVPNPSRRVLHQGREILIDQRGFPVFDDVAAFQTRLSDPVASVASRRLHMQEATRSLNAAIERGETAASQFTPQQLRAIKAGREKIPGFTWHHHQQFGRMQLIPSDAHQAVGHSGGFKLWY